MRNNPSHATASAFLRSRAPAATAMAPPSSCPHANTGRLPALVRAKRSAPSPSFTQRDANASWSSESTAPGPAGPKSR